MAKTEKDIKDEYRRNLDPKEFQEFKLRGLKNDKSENNYDFWFKQLYKFFANGNFGPKSRLLELGSGPTVHNVASASAFIPYMVLSEFVEANCDQLRLWLRKDPGRIDWSPFLKRVARAEGRSDLDAACQEIEERIRQAVKNVVHCDVLEDEMVPPEVSQKPYDVVLSALTLETAAASKISYSAILGRIRKLICSKGKLVLIGPINCSYWNVGNNKFHCLPLEAEDIKQALEANNFGDIEFVLRDKPDEKLPFDCTQLYFLTCTKY